MTKKLLVLLSLWGGLRKEVREAVEYSVRLGKSSCELWISDDDQEKKSLKQLGFEVEVITKDGISWEYIKISWTNLKEE